MVITVTGSTGTIGRELLRRLAAAQASTRAVFRNASKIQPLHDVVWLQADLRNARVLEPTLAGTTRLFLLTDTEKRFSRLQIDVLRAAENLGVSHVVKLSALGASDHSRSSIAREHWEAEQALQQTSMTWTILRPHAFMQNWLGEIADSVRAAGIIESPIGDGRVPFIDTRDIAAVAAEALLHPEDHAGHKYVLTGSEAVAFADLAAALTDLIGKDRELPADPDGRGPGAHGGERDVSRSSRGDARNRRVPEGGWPDLDGVRQGRAHPRKAPSDDPRLRAGPRRSIQGLTVADPSRLFTRHVATSLPADQAHCKRLIE